jgi:hypothetical protein
LGPKNQRKGLKFVDDFEIVLLIIKALESIFRLKNFYFFLYLISPSHGVEFAIAEQSWWNDHGLSMRRNGEMACKVRRFFCGAFSAGCGDFAGADT